MGGRNLGGGKLRYGAAEMMRWGCVYEVRIGRHLLASVTRASTVTTSPTTTQADAAPHPKQNPEHEPNRTEKPGKFPDRMATLNP